MPVTEQTRVTSCHIRWPLRLNGHVVYRLIVADGGDYVSAKPPDIYDTAGQPTTLTAELAHGSLVRVEHNSGVLRAVQLLDAKFDNPFLRIWAFLANGGDTGGDTAPLCTLWNGVFWGFAGIVKKRKLADQRSVNSSHEDHGKPRDVEEMNGQGH